MQRQKTPNRWLPRCALYGMTASYVLPVIMFGTGATILFADRKWLGTSICAAACIVYAVVGWKRLHGKLTSTKPALILELRRRLNH
jgi:hypothetical protein